MRLDWCPGIREACGYWRDAPMLQQTFEALEDALEQDNDACIDCAKTIVEVVCRAVVESFHAPQSPLKPTQETPPLSNWLTSAIRALKLGDVRDEKSNKLVSNRYTPADTLAELRNRARPATYREDAYLERLAGRHRLNAVLEVEAIVTLLYVVCLNGQLEPSYAHEMWERFAEQIAPIDAYVESALDADEGDIPTLCFPRPDGDELSHRIGVNRLSFQLDRDVCEEVLLAARGVAVSVMGPVEIQGEP